ncbi:zinc finger protein 629-like isoform X1 [Trichoplusia ni]|uniref:Zinc finger protein 629-like isoform X1 n=1 Tax=Trichoplusia ni TaxID=7111 RepID=A0A7E5W9B4_TRINI|nr:zinc finger protein 629-like isoform X1 [Trichoplusia ni]XP_026737237.1 zinc finger protein 629-like isoform X1 [Trichoplusia ni]
MGSEHYCLRWNNHQSNLLGVFSQLLHDESLVDVTLACSEGASIRAHKVVLSACSSYFRSLFVDHPSRHPIVILKDVGLEELRTLVDFMYKGEVNVQYCQLPALLKTAESLQVKGLAEMTTLSAAGIETRKVAEPMEECQSQDTRESSESHEKVDGRDHRDKEDRRELKEAREGRDRENKDSRDVRESHTRDSRESRESREHREQREPRDLREPRDIRETRDPRDLRDPRDVREHRESRENRDIPRDLREVRDPRELRESRETRDSREMPEASPPRISPLLSVRRFRPETAAETLAPTHPPIPKDEPPDEPMRSSSPEEDTVSLRSNGAQNEPIGLNMTINSHSSSSVLGAHYSPVEPRLSVLNTIPHPGLTHPSHASLPSPRSEPIAGPSGLPPVQQVPLSLKKEIDWDRPNDDKVGGETSEYRMQHESMCVDMSCAPPALASPSALPLWSPLLALQACRLRRYLSDDCMLYHNRHLLHSERRRCGVCLASFPSAWLLERHAALQHASQAPCDDKPFVCEQCGQSYRYRSAYVKHREQNHRARLPADKLFTCDVCGMQFRYLKSFKKHRLNHTLERLHTKNTDTPEGTDQVSSTNEALIGQCGEMDLSMKKKNRNDTAKTSAEVIRDAEQDSTVDSNGPTDSVVTVDDSTECRTSGAESETKREDDTTSERKRRIPVSFASISSMADSSENESRADSSKHESSSSHSGILNFMQNDDRQRDRERRFACPFCGKCVRSKENLKLHVRKHTGERPFVCLFCGRAFGGKSDLTRHLRIHTGERPYHCEACGKCFARADYLSKHLTTHVHNTR